MPSFIRPVPEERKVLAFSKDVRKGQLPTTVEVKHERLQVEVEAVPSSQTAQGNPSIPEQTETSDRVSAPQALTVPLKIIHPLFRSPFLSPMSSWHLL